MIVDTGKQFINKEFTQHVNSMGIKVKIILVKARNSIGIVKRYHGPIRHAYFIVSIKIPGINKDIAL